MLITIYADYVCPYCLLVEAALHDAIGKRPLKLDWRAFELRPDPVPTLRPEDPYLPKVWRESVYPLAEQLAVNIRLPSLSPQPRSTLAFQLLHLANQYHAGHAYSMAVMRAFFQQDQDIGDADVLVNIAADVGLDPAIARGALKEGLFVDAHRLALQHAREDMAVTSVPTLVIGDRILRGISSPTSLAEAIAKL